MIVQISKKPTVKFEYVPFGTCFIYDNEAFIKCWAPAENKHFKFNAAKLADGRFAYFLPSDEVYIAPDLRVVD